MPKQVKLTHVRSHLERVERFCEMCIEDNGRFPNGLSLPPAYLDEVRGIRMMTSVILRKHREKGTRKDIQIEVK